MKQTILAFFLLLSTSLFINAQSDFRPAYIIKLNGDTLEGEIDYQGDKLMATTCKFQFSIDKKLAFYSPKDIAGYRFKEGKFFISREIVMNSIRKTVFLEFLIKGKISIYYMRDDQGDHYFIEKQNLGFSEFPNESDEMYKEGTKYYHKPTKYIGILNYYMQDAPGFSQKAASMDIPQHNNLIQIARDYHNAVCKDSACIVYEKKLPLIKLAIEPSASFEINRNLEFNHNNILLFGCNFYVWLPRTNENVYFKIGFNYGKRDSISMIKIPIHFQYVFPKGILRPKFSIGYDYFRLRENGVSDIAQLMDLGTGFILKLYKNAYLSANVNAMATPVWIALYSKDFEIISYSCQLGIYIEL